jgi:hypothetical protein
LLPPLYLLNRPLIDSRSKRNNRRNSDDLLPLLFGLRVLCTDSGRIRHIPYSSDNNKYRSRTSGMYRFETPYRQIRGLLHNDGKTLFSFNPLALSNLAGLF